MKYEGMSLKIYQIMQPQKIRFGGGALNTLADEANILGARRALIVTGPTVYQSGLVEPVMEQLAKAGLSVEIFSEAEPEPTLPKLNAAAKELRKDNYDLLVGLGGGSSMDTAKGLSVLLAHGGDGQGYSPGKRCPL